MALRLRRKNLPSPNSESSTPSSQGDGEHQGGSPPPHTRRDGSTTPGPGRDGGPVRAADVPIPRRSVSPCTVPRPAQGGRRRRVLLRAPDDDGGSGDGSGCLVDGVVPFRCTPASRHEARLAEGGDEGGGTASCAEAAKSPDVVVANRRERARVFTRMFSGRAGGGRPPNRGANVVATIGGGDARCPRLQKALFLLGTYYNLFVVVDGSGAALGGEGEMREFVERTRSDLLNRGEGGPSPGGEHRLSAEVLPPHRISFSSTARGRVAFVRQLGKAELVVDSDGEVTRELERFGFRVFLYPKGGEGGASALGKFLVP